VAATSLVVVFRVKAVAKHVAHLAVPLGTHFYTREYRQVLLSGQLLNTGNRIDTVMVGDSHQVEAFGNQVVDELFGRPASIAIGGMHVKIDRGVGGKCEIGGQERQNWLLY